MRDRNKRKDPRRSCLPGSEGECCVMIHLKGFVAVTLILSMSYFLVRDKSGTALSAKPIKSADIQIGPLQSPMPFLFAKVLNFH